MKPTRLRQRGATLLVSLIFLVMMTLFAVTAFNMGKTSLQAVGNMQQRNQTLVTAQEAINDTISSTKFIDTPTAVLSNNSNEMKVDINGDGKDDVEVKIKQPTCTKSRNILLGELDVQNSEDQICTLMQGQDFGIEKSEAKAKDYPSSCGEGLWEIEATARDLVSEVTVTVTQGVGVRVDENKRVDFCK